MTPDSWKEFAIQIMHDFPEVGVGVDNGQRTPLFLYTLYLGDTAVATRESQDARTTRYIDNIGELLHQFIVLNPDALDVVDEYDLTPLAQISNSRLATVRGSKRYNLSPIIKVMKRLLSRDASYWKLATNIVSTASVVKLKSGVRLISSPFNVQFKNSHSGPPGKIEIDTNEQ